MNKGIVFKRIHGKIVPIKAGKLAAGAAVTTGAAVAVSRSKKQETNGPNRLYQAGALGLNLTSAAVSAFPFKGKLGFALSQGGSFGIDALGTSLNAASVAKMKGSKKQKLKEFAKAEAISQGVGYAAWAGMLLANPAVRSKVVSFSKTVLGRIGKFGVKAAL